MILQLTDYAVGILATDPAPQLDVFKIGSGYNYVPLPTDIDIHGSLLFSGLISTPTVISANVVKYSISMDNSVGDFDWGEVGFMYQGSLFALGVSNSLQEKRKNAVELGNNVRLDAYLTVVGTNYNMIVDQAESNNLFQMASLSTVDQLPPTNATTPNVYIISAAAANQSSFQAYTDRIGLWNFDAYQYSSGAKATVVGSDVQSVTIALADFSPNMDPSYFGEVILEFITGANYSICRYVASAVQSGGSVTFGFSTPIAVLPVAGDKIQVFSRVAQSAALEIPIATASVLGGIKIGNGLQVAGDGTCSVDLSSIGAVTMVNGKPGPIVNLVATDIPGFGAVAYSNNYNDLSNLPTPYALPLMSLAVRGGAKLPASGNLILSGEQIDLSFAPVKTVNGIGPDGTGNVNLATLVKGLVNPTAVPSAADLNTYTTTGLFTISAAVISTLSNAPTASGAATLEIVPLTTGGTGDSVQRFSNDSSIYWRKNTGASWGPWNQVASNAIATTTTVGVIKVGAGLNIDITGNLTPRVASALVTGVVRAGSGLAVDPNGLLSVDFPIATASTVGVVKAGSGLIVDGTGLLSINPATLPIATTTTLGVVKVGIGLTIDGTGKLDVNPPTVPVATTSSLGVVKIGSGISVAGDGTISWNPASLPIATAAVLGAIKIGAGLTAAGDGTTSANLRTVNGTLPDGLGNVVVTAPPDANKLDRINGVAQGIRLTFTDLGSIAGGGSVGVVQSSANVQAATFSTGSVTWAFSGWPASGTYAEVQFEVINGGTATHAFPVGLKWVNPDGTFTTSLSTYLTNQRGTTNFQTSGIDFCLFWTRNNGVDIYAKIL